LAAVLKWTLARLGRVFPVPIPVHEQSIKKGEPAADQNILVHQRGFLDLEIYSRWAAAEKKNGHPATAFSSFLDNLGSSSLALIVALFSLLSSTTSYSHKNGMSPSRLARLFGPLLFGLPEDETFEKTYEAFVKAGNATEHLLLAYIRDSGTIESLPTRLADHVKGYPAMLSSDTTKSSRSVRGVPMTHVNRTVRLYSLDLLQTACEMDVADQCPEWKACCASNDSVGKDPQLSDRYRNLINLRSAKKQGRSSSTPKGSVEIEHYTSLVDKKWGDFMHEGFSAPDDSKLTFDLRESERKARNERPGSVHWSQFEKSGFVFADDGLASVLSFDDGLREDMEKWPAERAELMDKLRKATQKIPEFPYDTTPYIVSSPSLDLNESGQWEKKPVSRFDEVFAEVYADTLLGNGWSNRDEQTHRNSNFAVVQYKSRPTPSTVGSQSSGASNQTRSQAEDADDRMDAAWFVVEEIVPSHYRSELEASGRPKTKSRASLRKLNIFRKRKEEVSGGGGSLGANAGGNSSRYLTNDRSSFDDVFRPGAGGSTKKLYLGKDPASFSPNLERKSSASTVRQNQWAGEGEESSGGSKLKTTLSSLTTMRTKSVKMKKRDDDAPPPTPPKNGMTASTSFGSEDFDTRSLHDAELDKFNQADSRKRGLLKHGRRQSKDDSWLDVMIRANGFRMAGQDAPMPASVPASVPHKEAEDKTPTRETTPTLPKEPFNPAVTAPKRSSSSEASTGLGLDNDSVPMPPTKMGMVPDTGSKAYPPKDSLQVAGWTREEAGSSTLAPPKRDASLPKFLPERTGDSRTPSPSYRKSPPKEIEVPTPTLPEKSQKEVAPEEVEEESQDSPAKLAYLKPLPPQSDSLAEREEREKARDVRIQAAKDRAKELRANLNPVVLNELENRKEFATKPLPPLTPVKSPARATQTPSPQSSTTSSSQPRKPKDDPFAKDRFSGRVASVASKFGGGGAATTSNPLSPQSTGGSAKMIPTSPGRIGDKSSDSSTSSKIIYPPSLPAEPSTMDPNEPVPRTSLESNNALGVDNDSIYPDDAASNFSRDTEPEEIMVGGKSLNSPTSLRQGGSIAASTPAVQDGNKTTPDLGRKEEEDRPRDMPPGFRVPYQPGMPLSNLEEESESVLSGSNNA